MLDVNKIRPFLTFGYVLDGVPWEEDQSLLWEKQVGLDQPGCPVKLQLSWIDEKCVVILCIPGYCFQLHDSEPAYIYLAGNCRGVKSSSAYRRFRDFCADNIQETYGLEPDWILGLTIE